MRTLFQDDEGTIPEVEGQICETLLCIQVVDDQDKSVKPGVFWMKVFEGRWHRFYIDSSYYFLVWTERAELDRTELEDVEDFPVFDVDERFGLNGLQIKTVKMYQEHGENGSTGRLEIEYAEGRKLILEHGDNRNELIIN